MSIWEQAKLAESVLKVQVKLKRYIKRDEITEARTDHSLPAPDWITEARHTKEAQTF